MISYEFPISEFCRQFSQPSLFKTASFQFFGQETPANFHASQQASAAHDVDFYLFQEQQQNERRNVSSLELEAEKLSELTKRKAMLERALAQTLHELNGSKL
jgi:hypothetical protein